MLPVVLYGCKSWSPTLTKGCSLRLLENMVLRKVFGPEREEVTYDMIYRVFQKELYNFESV